MRLGDVATVFDDVENNRVAAWTNGKRSVVLIIRRQPGANIIETIDRVDRAAALRCRTRSRPRSTSSVALDRAQTIRASVHDVEFTLVLSVVLVVVVVFVFLRSVRATLIPSVAVPLSLVGTFGVMYLLGYSLDNLSLMALTISTGFVVDDAIVVTENISRFIEQGEPPIEAALKGAKQIGFTIVSITVSLLAVFIPILLMGGIVGRLFREFAVTLSIAIARLGGRLADAHADDVLAAPQARARGEPRAPLPARRSASSRAWSPSTSAGSAGCSTTSGVTLAVTLRHARAHGLPLRRSSPRASSRSRTRAR